MSREKLKKFLAYYRKRIREDPANVETRLRLATVFRELGQSHRAIDQYEQAAQLLDQQGLALEAIAACKAILELDPSRVEAQYFLARLYAQTPDATDHSARVAQPVEPADDEPTHELEPTAEKEASPGDDHPPEPEVVDESIERPEREGTPDPEPTRVADYGDLPDDDFEVDEEESPGIDESGTLELTEEERQRREGFSREEMQDLLTTIDVDADDIVEEYEEFDELEEPVAGTDLEMEDEMAIRETDEFEPSERDDAPDTEDSGPRYDEPSTETEAFGQGAEESDARYNADVDDE